MERPGERALLAGPVVILLLVTRGIAGSGSVYIQVADNGKLRRVPRSSEADICSRGSECLHFVAKCGTLI